MKIEKLRNNHKKEIIIGTILTVVIGGVLTFRLTHSKYRVTQSIDLGSGVINYTSSDFQIMAVKVSDDGENYSDTNSVPTSGYTLNTTKSVCNVDNTKDNNITIEYSNGKVNFKNVTKKGTKCYLYFDKDIGIPATSVLDLIAKLQSKAKTNTPDFSKIADTDEGVYATADGTNMYSGTTYYWRGTVTTNHVIFANKCWKIIRINGDKTMRLIYNGDVLSNNTCFGNGENANSIAVTNQSYNPTRNEPYYVGWTQNGTQRTNSNTATSSNAKTQTEEWYKDASRGNLKVYEEKIANGKFCNDRDVGQPLSSWSGYVTSWTIDGTSFAYAGAKRLYESYSPTFNCPSGDIYTLKVGAITADEISFAGGKNENNTSYYLYNGQNYWTMSPIRWTGAGARVFYMNSSGYLSDGWVYANFGLRPVINLKSDVTFSSGDGTISSPYVVSQI